MINISISDEAIQLFKAKSENLKELIRKRAVAKLADEIYQNAFNRADAHTQTGVLLSALYNRKKAICATKWALIISVQATAFSSITALNRMK